MKINSFSLIAFAGVTAITMASCSDELDAPSTNKTTVETTHQVVNSDDVFTYQGTNASNGLAVKMDGVNATVLKGNTNAIGDLACNATVTYTKDDKSEGYLEMKDNSLGVKKMKFMTIDNLLSLDFSENQSMYNGVVVYLNKPVNTQLAISRGGATVGDTDPVKLAEQISQKLLTLGAKALLGNVGEAVFSPLISALFPGDSGASAEYSQLQDQIAVLGKQIAEVKAAIEKYKLTTAYHEHWQDISQLAEHNEMYQKFIAANPGEELKYLELWATTNVSSFTPLGGLKSRIQYYMNNYDPDNSWFNIIDGYIFYCHPWEAQGYTERDLMRVEDLTTFTEATRMLQRYCDLKGVQDTGLLNCLDSYLAYYDKMSVYPKHLDKAVCQIDGAYMIIDKQPGILTMGEGTFPNNKITISAHDDSFYEQNGNWKYSYVFSKKGVSKNTPELQESCMAGSEAKAIVNYYGGSKNLYNILHEDGGVYQMNHNQLLLKDRVYADWYQYQSALFRDESKTYIMGSVWDRSTNKYNDNFLLDDVIFENHNNWSWTEVYVSLSFKSHKENQYFDYVVAQHSSLDELQKYQRSGQDSVKK